MYGHAYNVRAHNTNSTTNNHRFGHKNPIVLHTSANRNKLDILELNVRN